MQTENLTTREQIEQHEAMLYEQVQRGYESGYLSFDEYLDKLEQLNAWAISALQSLASKGLSL